MASRFKALPFETFEINGLADQVISINKNMHVGFWHNVGAFFNIKAPGIFLDFALPGLLPSDCLFCIQRRALSRFFH